MNDKLSQSIKARLSGMQWCEGEQAEVLRQIQRKEMQDVKHAKRGAGMLVIAVTLLFLVAGAAFAVGTMPQPEKTPGSSAWRAAGTTTTAPSSRPN